MEQPYSSIEKHIVILGWSERVQRIVGELRSEEQSSGSETRPIGAYQGLQSSAVIQ